VHVHLFSPSVHELQYRLEVEKGIHSSEFRGSTSNKWTFELPPSKASSHQQTFEQFHKKSHVSLWQLLSGPGIPETQNTIPMDAG
jgi:hypothetical protein